jgi:hypothetical protein
MILADILREDLYTDDASEVRRPKLSTISSPIPIRESNSYMGGVMFKYGSVLTKPKYPHPYDIRPERSLSHFSDV